MTACAVLHDICLGAGDEVQDVTLDGEEVSEAPWWDSVYAEVSAGHDYIFS